MKYEITKYKTGIGSRRIVGKLFNEKKGVKRKVYQGFIRGKGTNEFYFEHYGRKHHIPVGKLIDEYTGFSPDWVDYLKQLCGVGE